MRKDPTHSSQMNKHKQRHKHTYKEEDEIERNNGSERDRERTRLTNKMRQVEVKFWNTNKCMGLSWCERKWNEMNVCVRVCRVWVWQNFWHVAYTHTYKHKR